MANTEIEAKFPELRKSIILLGAFFPILLRFFYCRVFIKERRVNPPLFKDFLRAQSLPYSSLKIHHPFLKTFQ
jgi:hypothetical protein